MFISFMFFINILFLNFNNPLIMGLLMFLQTLNLIMIMGKIYYSFWFSYILFLVFIGGLFILFLYFISLTFNNKYLMIKNYKNLLIFLSFILLIILIKNKNFFMNNYEINKMLINKNNIINSLKFFNFPNNILNILLIIYLLIMMIIIVKITNFYKGPIRIIK